MTEKVMVRYLVDVPAAPSHRAYKAGETFAVRNAEAAGTLHPEATIIGMADGKPYVPAAVESKLPSPTKKRTGAIAQTAASETVETREGAE